MPILATKAGSALNATFSFQATSLPTSFSFLHALSSPRRCRRKATNSPTAHMIVSSTPRNSGGRQAVGMLGCCVDSLVRVLPPACSNPPSAVPTFAIRLAKYPSWCGLPGNTGASAVSLSHPGITPEAGRVVGYSPDDVLEVTLAPPPLAGTAGPSARLVDVFAAREAALAHRLAVAV